MGDVWTAPPSSTGSQLEYGRVMIRLVQYEGVGVFSFPPRQIQNRGVVDQFIRHKLYRGLRQD